MILFSIKNLFILMLTLLIIGSGWLLYKNIFQSEHFITQSKTNPTAILQGVATTNYDTDGTVKSHLTASELIYYSGVHKSEFTNPALTFYQPDKTPWNITAEKGIAINNNEKITLSNNVKIKQDLGKNNPETTILTSELTIFPNTNYATTEKPIDFTQVNADKTKITMQSIGATANQKTGEIRLLSKIRGTYAPF